MPLNNAKITKSARQQIPRNRDKMPHADAETHASYLDAKGAYAVRQMCAKTLTFTMYITHVVSIYTFVHAILVFKFCTG